MKKKELQEFKSKSAEELDKALADLRKKKLESEVALSTGKESDLKTLKKIRRDIAQIMTIRGIIDRSEEKKGEKAQDK